MAIDTSSLGVQESLDFSSEIYKKYDEFKYQAVFKPYDLKLDDAK